MFVRRALWSFLLAAACTSAGPDAEFETWRAQLQTTSFEDFEILEVVPESNAEMVRVNIRLTPPSVDASEIRRRTLNAVSSVQTIVPEDRRVSVWTYGGGTAVEGMAFFVPVTATLVYKSAEELP